MTIKQLTKLIMTQADEKGFGISTKDINVPEKIALIHAQLSSAYEGYRNKNMTGPYSFENEIAGTLQRIIHLCGVLDINIEKALLDKIKENKSRKWDWKSLNEKHASKKKK
jgi:hypothetical protein